MNDENLIPQSNRSPNEVREMGRKGGINSGKARRRKKQMREWAEIIGGLAAKVVGPDGKNLRGADLNADVIMQQYRAAHKGSTKAAQFLANVLGEETFAPVNAPVIVVRDKEEEQELIDVLKSGR